MKNIYTFHQWKIQNANDLIRGNGDDEKQNGKTKYYLVSCSFVRKIAKWQHRRCLRSRIGFGKWKFTRFLKPRSPGHAPV